MCAVYLISQCIWNKEWSSSLERHFFPQNKGARAGPTGTTAMGPMLEAKLMNLIKGRLQKFWLSNNFSVKLTHSRAPAASPDQSWYASNTTAKNYLFGSESKDSCLWVLIMWAQQFSCNGVAINISHHASLSACLLFHQPHSSRQKWSVTFSLRGITLSFRSLLWFEYTIQPEEDSITFLFSYIIVNISTYFLLFVFHSLTRKYIIKLIFTAFIVLRE